MREQPVFYFTRVVPDYRIPILDRLNERLSGRLIVCSGQAPDQSSLSTLITDRQPEFRHELLHNYWLFGEKVHAQPYKNIFAKYGMPSSLLIEESPRSVTLPFLMRFAHQRDIGCALWGHFSSNNRPFAPESNLQDRYRLSLARSADACVCYTTSIANLLKPYMSHNKVFVAQNTLDTDTLFSLSDSLHDKGKREVRQSLGLETDIPTMVFVGRLIEDKGTELLLDVYEALLDDGPAQLIIIGDGPERQAMEMRVAHSNIDGVHFVGTIPEWERSGPYMYASDVMLIPGYLGLAVNHAFAFGVPVVSQAPRPGIRFHSPEASYIESGQNGVLAASDRCSDLLKAVRSVLDEQDRYSHNASNYARQNLTIDNMVSGLENAIKFVEAPSRCESS